MNDMRYTVYDVMRYTFNKRHKVIDITQ